MIEIEATEIKAPENGEKAYDWYRSAYTKRIDSVLTTLCFTEGYSSVVFKRRMAGQQGALKRWGFDFEREGDIKRAAFMRIVTRAVKQHGGGQAWEMMRRFAQSAYDDLTKLEASGEAPGPIPKISQ